ncbi:MAG TPA: MFS transporter [Candidatus Sulfotelmatobacter sp.]|jgi:MFS family permease|nr:MFS transporter [Candidatus Sulfotelmatobacter sp.]
MAQPLWKQHNFALLLGGQFVSYIGTEVSDIALPLIVLVLTGSPAQAGIIAAIRGFIYLFLAIPVGVLVDRWDNKVIMIVGNLGSGLAIGSIAVALIFHQLTLTQLYLVNVFEGICFVFANLARFKSFSKVVSKEQFPTAIALWNTTFNTALLVGPPLGGFLYQTIGAFMTFFTDSLSYFLNILSIFFINIPLRTVGTQHKAFHHEAQEGINWLWNHHIIRFLNILISGYAILETGLYLIIVVLAREHHATSLTIGLIFACGAIGGIIASLFLTNILKRFPFHQLLNRITFLSLLIFICFAFTINNITLAIVTAAFYAINPFTDITISSYFTTAIPEEIRGRVSSIIRLVELGSNSLGFFITGMLLQYMGSRWTIEIFSCLLFFLFIVTFTNKNLDTI